MYIYIYLYIYISIYIYIYAHICVRRSREEGARGCLEKRAACVAEKRKDEGGG